MIILHAGFIEEVVHLWGEQPLEADTPSRRPRTHSSKHVHPASFPYGTPGQELLTALHNNGISVPGESLRPQSMTVWLPTVNRKPVVSSPMIAEVPEVSCKSEIVPWMVTTCPLSPEATLDLLCGCVGKQTLAPGIIVGRDLAFWATALRFAGSLVARQQFLPGLLKHRGMFRASWEPVIAGADAERLAQLAKGMPAVARALSPEAVSAPDLPASTVLSRFVARAVDSLVRSTAASSGLTSRVPTGLRTGRASKKDGSEFSSLHDQWLYALRRADGIMTGKESDLMQFVEQVREWQRPVALSTKAPFRLCFRLEEPEREAESTPVSPELSGVDHASAGLARAQAGPWYVRYVLQPVDDPSLLVPVSEIWVSKGRTSALLNRRGTNLQEFTLSALGQASGISQNIEQSLQGSLPGGYELDTSGAHAFLIETALALEQAGFGVMLPAWWAGKGTKLRLTAHATVRSPKMQGGGGLSLDQVVQFDWEVALGDEKLSLQDLRLLAKLKAPLVKVRGQWVEMSREEIQAALDLWKKKAAGTATVREVVRMALGARETTAGIAFGGVNAAGWIAELLAELEGHASFEELPTPSRFRGTLRPYQVRGFSWLSFLRRWGLGACLADDMGLGKTPQTLALIQHEWQERASTRKRPMLLICPTSVVSNWHKEAARFTPDLPVLVHHGLERTKGAAFKKAARKQAIVVSSYALLHRDLSHLQEVEWGGVILDEAQNIKNPETLQARAARALRADVRIALTGTPVENNVGDLWSIVEFLNPGFLGTQAEFKRRFFIPIQANHDREAGARLKRLTGPFVLRRLKTDRSIIADLPDKQEMKVFCTLTKEQASLYAAVVKDAEATLTTSEGIQRKGVVLATISKLKQVCNHPAQFLGDRSALPGRSGKLARLTEMLEEMLAIGERALIFSQFSKMGNLLQRHLQETFGREVLFLHGGVPQKQRDRMVTRFQAGGADGQDGAHDDGPPIFILSLKAGGTGLNLTRASHVFHFDRWWNPAVENQARDRAFRIGQTQNVQVHKYLCAGTLEEKIDELIERKKDVAEQVIGTGEGWLTELSNDELKELFALRPEAVGV